MEDQAVRTTSEADIEKLKKEIEGQKLLLDFNLQKNIKILGFILLIVIIILALIALVFSFLAYPDFRENIATILANNIVTAFIGILILLGITPNNKENQ